MNQTLFGLAGMVIPPLGALALAGLPMQGILAIDVVTATAAIGCLAVIRVPRPPRDPALAAGGAGPSVWAEMGVGLRFVLGWKGLWQFAAIGVVIHMLGQAAGSLTPLLVTQHFAGGAMQYGWLQSALGIGTLAGGLGLGIWGGLKRRIPTSLAGLVLDGLVIIAIALTPKDAFVLAVAGMFAMGGLEAIVVGLNGAAGQAVIPPEMQGRVFSLIASTTQLMAPLGLLLAGPIADLLGVRLWWVLTGITISLMGVVALFAPAIMRLEDGQPRAALRPA
jgi:DHA3 family macrolide efflux protein-like MFS transporter